MWGVDTLLIKQASGAVGYWVPWCLFFSLIASDTKIVDPTCCSRSRTPLLWGHAETWCGQTPAWCRQSPCLGTPSPGLRQTWRRRRAWPTGRWPQQTPAPPECPQPSGKRREKKHSTKHRCFVLRRQPKLWTHHNHVLAQESPNISWGVLNGKASPVLDVGLWFGGIVSVMRNWKFASIVSYKTPFSK